MYFKVGQIRPYLSGNEVRYGKIISIDEESEIFIMEDTENKKQVMVDEAEVFIGDD